MSLGKVLGSISPAFGAASGKGLFGNADLWGTLSPLYGAVSGNGLFGSLLEAILGKGKDKPEAEDEQARMNAMLASLMGGQGRY